VKRVSLAALATLALIGASACQDAVTSPQPGAEVRNGVSYPPPPPEQLTASGSFCCTTSSVSSIQQSSGFQPSLTKKLSGLQPSFPKQSTGFRPLFSIQGSPLLRPRLTIQSGCTTFFVPATYMFNEPSNSGYVHFSSDPNNDVTSSANGMVKYASGDFSGAGTLEILTDCGLIVIDISSVNDASSFFGGQFAGFNLFFDSALLYPCGTTDCTPTVGSADIFGGGGD